MPAVGPMVEYKPLPTDLNKLYDPNANYGDPVVQSAQLRNRYDAWSRLSSPAQQVLNKLGPTDAFDHMAQNFKATEDGLRAQGFDPYRDARSAQMSMQQVDTSPSATAMRMLAPQGNKGAAMGLDNLHKRFDSAQAKQEALKGYESIAKRDLAAAQAQQKSQLMMKQAEMDAAIAKQQAINEGQLNVEKQRGLTNTQISKLQGENAALREKNKMNGEHQRKIGAVDKSIAGLFAKYGNAQARQMQFSQYITNPAEWFAAQGYKNAPTDAAGFAQWLVTQPDAAIRLGIDPAVLKAYVTERGYNTPEQPNPMQQLMPQGGFIDNIKALLSPQQSGAFAGVNAGGTGNVPAVRPQQPMVGDPYADRGAGQWTQGGLPEPLPTADHQFIQQSVANLSPQEFQAKMAEMEAAGAPPSVMNAMRQYYIPPQGVALGR